MGNEFDPDNRTSWIQWSGIISRNYTQAFVIEDHFKDSKYNYLA